jgi:LuxR family maltose regulon positive regulatory protein
LTEAARTCQAEGFADLADRARADLLFTRAFGGDFAGALAGIEVDRSDPDDSGWRRVDGAIEAFTLGWISFWSGDCDTAARAFSDAMHSGGGITSFGPLARVWLVHAALARGIATEIAEAEKALELLPESTIQGIPWNHYKGIAQAGIMRYRADQASAIRLLEQAANTDAFTPATRVLAAELYWLCGRPAEALAQTEQLLRAPDYLRVSGLVVSALCARATGDVNGASELLEEALGIGVALGITRPFQLADNSTAEILTEQAARGTRFESFLAEQIAWHARHRQVLGDHPSLSAREREILSYLATTMSANEICQALFVSTNTLKTHLKSVYRKLGVDNRRDAVRLAHASQNH